MQCLLTVLVVAPVSIVSAEVRAQDPEDLFSKVFGGRSAPKREQRFDAPVRFLLYELGTVPIRITSEGHVSAEKTALIDVIGQVVSDGPLQGMADLEAPDGFLPLDGIADAGVTLTYDPATLGLVLDVPWDSQRIIDLSLAAPPRRTPNPPHGPAKFSAILNLRGALDVATGGQDTDGQGGESGRPVYNGDIAAAIRIGPAVFEASANLASDSQPWIRVNGTRMFADDVSGRTRFQAGEVDYATAGFQTRPRIMGLAVGRNFNLQPDRPFRPRGSRMVEVERDTVIEVLTNGQVIDTIAVGPGRYRITDLPLTLGGNDFQIRLTDDLNREESIDLSLFFDPGLLGRGETDFSMAAGFATVNGETINTPDTEDWVLTSFYRRGVLDTLTLGMTTQVDRRAINLGGQAGWAGPLGSIGVLAEGSRVSGREGAAVTLQWEKPGIGFAGPRGSGDYRLDAGMIARYETKRYAPFRNDPLANDLLSDVSVRVGQSFPRGWRLGLTGTRRYLRENGEDTSFSTSLGKRLSPFASLDFLGNVRQSSDGTTAADASMTFTLAFGSSHSVRLSGATRDQSLSGRVARRSRRLIDDWTGELEAVRRPSAGEVETVLRYGGQRFEADARHRIVSGPDPDISEIHRSTLSLGTAFVMAGAHPAISRPVDGSFALIRRHENFRDTEIVINPSGESYRARTDGVGPLVVPGLSAHLLQQIRIDAPEIKVGQDIGEERPFLRPAFQSGVVLTAGTAASIILTAVLAGPDGVAFGLAAGEIKRLGGSEDEPVVQTFFTNRDGRIAVDGLWPGRYGIRLFGRKKGQGDLVIDPASQGFVDAGKVVLQ